MVFRKNASKFFAVQLSLLLLAIMAGFQIEVHWCGGEIAAVQPLYASNLSSTPNACCGAEEPVRKCCHNEHIEWKQQSHHWFHQHILNVEWTALLPDSFVHNLVVPKPSFSTASALPIRPKQSHAPPPYILYSTLIFYA